ncbi:PDZ domain-containing protein [Candidatus Peregrinibacteria bacterium]|nr:PDZ domain-containing protein [Candidatus Peregrinibacteria bacterium]
MNKLHRFLSLFTVSFFALNVLFSGLAYADYKGVLDSSIYKALEKRGAISNSANFDSEAPCNRAEFYKMALASAGIKVEINDAATPFTDILPSAWFAPYIKKAIEASIISPSEIGPLFKPFEQISKIEALKILLIANKVPLPATVKKEDIKFNDIKSYLSLAKYAVAATKYGLFKNEILLKPNKLLLKKDAAYLIYEFINKGDILPVTQEITINILPSSSGSIADTEIGKQFTESTKFQILLDVLDKIDTKYVHKDKINLDEMTYGAIKGLVDKLDDKYTVFQEPAKATTFTKSLTGEFDGIGISIEMVDEKIVIVTPIKGTPASAAGIKPGDIIDKVDDQSVAGKTLDDVVNMIQGSIDTTVKLTILRDGKAINFSIKRAHIKIDSVTYETKANSIIYIEIANFTNNTPQEFQDILTKVLKENPKGFIIDLRNNPGGFLNAAIMLLNHFVPKDKLLMTMESANGNKIPYISKGPAELSSYPVYVLINKGSASASEIMAAAIREYGIGKLVGKPTFGKGTVQELINYTDGSMLRLSVAKWLTPNGNVITPENPLKPDYDVENQTNFDAQLIKAMDLLNAK